MFLESKTRIASQDEKRGKQPSGRRPRSIAAKTDNESSRHERCYSGLSPSNLREENVSDPTKEELMARIAELEKQVGGKKTGRTEFRVSEKGGVSVYGLGRFPVTLYYEQWQRLLAEADNLRAFLEENKGKLKLKAVE